MDLRVAVVAAGQVLASGRNILVHCLAGAHRAGTTGVACASAI